MRKSIDIALQIQDILQRKGWTQKELAAHTEQRPSFISRILAGKTNMTLQAIARIEDALGENLLVVPKYVHESKTMPFYQSEFPYSPANQPRTIAQDYPQRWRSILNVHDLSDAHHQTLSYAPTTLGVQKPHFSSHTQKTTPWIASPN